MTNAELDASTAESAEILRQWFDHTSDDQCTEVHEDGTCEHCLARECADHLIGRCKELEAERDRLLNVQDLISEILAKR